MAADKGSGGQKSTISSVTDSAYDLFIETKPYHTKVLEVVERYAFADSINVTVYDSLETTIIIENDPACGGSGWGFTYDDIFCGFGAPQGCCEPFDCAASGFGQVWDNSNLFAVYPVTSIDSSSQTLKVSGDITHDPVYPVVAFPDINQIRVDLIDPALFAGDGKTTANNPLFQVVTYRPYKIESVDAASNSLIVRGTQLQAFVGIEEVLVRTRGLEFKTRMVDASAYSATQLKVTLDSTQYTVSTNDIPGQLIVDSPTRNAGLYMLASDAEAPLTTNNGDGTTTIKIDTTQTQFNYLSDFEVGGLLLRQAIINPRVAFLMTDQGEQALTIVSSTYNSYADSTTMAFAQPLTLPGTLTNIKLGLRGYDGGTGMDGFAECKSTSDSMVAPYLTESLLVDEQQAPQSKIRRLALDLLAFSVVRASSSIDRSGVGGTASRTVDQFAFAAFGSRTVLLKVEPLNLRENDFMQTSALSGRTKVNVTPYMLYELPSDNAAASALTPQTLKDVLAMVLVEQPTDAQQLSALVPQSQINRSSLYAAKYLTAEDGTPLVTEGGKNLLTEPGAVPMTATTADMIKISELNPSTALDGTEEFVIVKGGATVRGTVREISSLDELEFTQSVAAATWVIIHNLNKYPSVTIMDPTGAEVYAAVSYPDKNTVQIDFSSPFAGTAYLN